ncbi:hypothetical protein ACFQ22_01890 [Lentilactobacillus raoultii]|uniref:D-alanyl-D-alanine carboxypeptidase n=1 Tax=Lentilactobacillus raoultii TaxID=1987503 RepID=A0ABW3PBZ5_9LACO|nr:hypothetical protein [Lentilactobacillus raoultii]
MKHQLIKGLAVALAGIATLFSTQSTTSAASQYSAKRSREVKLIWRKAMGRHAFTAPTGARFSKHLGTRYGYNTETANVTWYTDAHEKLYLKNLNMYSIYYHVTNSDQSLQGWIWKGYLKPATNDNSGTNPNNSNDGTSNNGSTSSSGSSTNSTSSSVPNSTSQELAGFFAGTQSNPQLQKIANQYPKYVNKDYELIRWAHKTYPEVVRYATFMFLDSNNDFVDANILRKQLIANQMSFKDYVTKVTVSDDSGQDRINSFPNSQIGAYAFSNKSSLYGQGVIIIVRNGQLPNS